MKSPNEQHLIAQELVKMVEDYNGHYKEPICYQYESDYKIVIPCGLGFIGGAFTTEIALLCSNHGIDFYISDIFPIDYLKEDRCTLFIIFH